MAGTNDHLHTGEMTNVPKIKMGTPEHALEQITLRSCPRCSSSHAYVSHGVGDCPETRSKPRGRVETPQPVNETPQSVNNTNAMIGIGGAPTRATTLPETASERKRFPIASGVLDYFPDAIVAIAYLSWKGNEQHNPGQPLHWARGKSADESDTLLRHFLQRGTLDTDGIRHTVKMAWRALAILQKEIEAEQAAKAAAKAAAK